MESEGEEVVIGMEFLKLNDRWIVEMLFRKIYIFLKVLYFEKEKVKWYFSIDFCKVGVVNIYFCSNSLDRDFKRVFV